MTRFKSIKLTASLSALVLTSNAYAGSVVIDAQKFNSYEELSDNYYGLFSTRMSNAITSRTLGKLELTKLDGKFAFVSPPLETWKERYIWVGGGLRKPSVDSQLMLGYSTQIQSEMIFHYFQNMGLIDHIDIVDESGFTKEVESNYDYTITMRSNFDGKRDAKSANSRITEFFVRNVKTGKEQRITWVTGSPVLFENFEVISVKLSDAVASIK